MEKTYTTGLVKNGENFSFTVSSRIVGRTKTRRKTPFRWSDEPGALTISPFHGTTEEAQERAKLYGDVVFLQHIRRANGSSQHKVNLPRWIYEAKGLSEIPDVRMTWSAVGGKIYGRILLPDYETTAT